MTDQPHSCPYCDLMFDYHEEVRDHILRDHHDFLKRLNVDPDSLRMPDPDEIESAIEAEMRNQIHHNLKAGIIRETGDGHFEYSFRGLLFLWGQFVKDMVRLC